MSDTIKAEMISKRYKQNTILRDLNFSVAPNSFFVLSGASGSGKSTLLNLLGLLDRFQTGELFLFGKKAPRPYTTAARKLLRNHIAYLFQNYALLEADSVYSNLAVVMEESKLSHAKKRQKMLEALEEVGLDGFLDKKVYTCSGGEQQRIAIARLMLKPCELVLADEPTGSLDKANKQLVLTLLERLREKGKTLVVATHDDDVRAHATGQIVLGGSSLEH